MEQWRIPQREVPVTLRLYSGRQSEGQFFVADVADAHGRVYSLTDRLNDDGERFLAFSGETRRLIAKASILYLVLSEDVGEGDPEDARPTVTLTLRDGSELSGDLPFSMPPDRHRLLDFLNAAPAFVRLEKGGRRWLVNRDAIQDIREDEAEKN
ncbi:MAG: hypothetical protein OEV00_14300 [Acidobacteriota bacterium]|nr:hypothetical protein [Acidobacteriota bacterium]MDH3786482.1 hypothetical protein [Acidobacteriota bacterium]